MLTTDDELLQRSNFGNRRFSRCAFRNNRDQGIMDDFTKNPELLLATLSSLYAAENRRKEVAVLAASKIMISHEYDDWDGGRY